MSDNKMGKALKHEFEEIKDYLWKKSIISKLSNIEHHLRNTQSMKFHLIRCDTSNPKNLSISEFKVMHTQ